MKHFVSIVILAVCVCVVLGGYRLLNNPPTPASGSSVDSSVNSSDKDNQTSSIPQQEDEPIINTNSWNMRLVNPWNSIPEDFDPELSLIDTKYAGFKDARFDARAIEDLHKMCSAAADDGIKLVIISAYRTNEFQTFNFNRKVERLMKADPTLSREQAEIDAAKVVAVPGTSEHQLGLAVDFNSVNDSFRNTKEYKWLIENCTDYGFILRYTAEKQDKTGIIPEPWHYRYVGVKEAKLIEESGLCLEEFIEKYSDIKWE